MYGECNNQACCNATAHYDCDECGENLCWRHFVAHIIKHIIMGRCYFWRHHN
jgi:hypothetical protein